jgi:hypothetical protein
MSSAGKDTKEVAASWRIRCRRLRLECRECEVICERVVSPSHCLSSKCRFVYSFADEQGEYFGCLHKIFAPELDLAALRRSLSGDSYGMLKAANRPRSECRSGVEQAYGRLVSNTCCCNPTFFHDPNSPRDEGMRLLVKRPSGQEPDGPEH